MVTVRRKPEILLWQCYGNVGDGVALVAALGREEAVRLCRYWCSWGNVTVWSAQEYLPVYRRAGGSPDRPVVYSRDRLRWDVVRERRAPGGVSVSGNITR